jgi:hypothetical protein
VLGFLLDDDLPIPDAPPAPDEDAVFNLGGLRTVTRLANLLNTATSAHDKSVIQAFERFVVRLPVKGIGTVEFNLSKERQAAVIAASRQVTAAYFDRPQAPAAVSPFGPPAGDPVGEAADQLAVQRLFK